MQADDKAAAGAEVDAAVTCPASRSSKQMKQPPFSRQCI